MSSIEIRKAQDDDLPVMQDIACRTIDNCYRPFLGDESVNWFISSGESDRELEKHIDNCDVLLKNGVAAFALYFDGLIHLMMVDVRLHRGGIGSALLEDVEKQLFASGKSTIRLETFEGNCQAINFYLKNGWTETSRQKDMENDFIRVLFEKNI
ncbi:GNAT family N-acetyltransferase [Candidatus Latescibacterota bacterium]